ncbi:hypothetical protein CC1G_15544 [Coprinopsis cinerea okayama7|uniref:Uncharacterized protein n=1 Tax=Coprinopsis cinerea (strain Okayama-7 / 130 / ATCC MYA-4618 / FGSC 9003) TaxID=240176 RepID=D6RN32_COPC7|nr:hypothetical protein CC1G_15544 [Coprinopsis cinerea okayama7\|eukprot:XP_002911003.1 hypothetical protein CC1G_15544 [Coprinopsis cinerea okayama7\
MSEKDGPAERLKARFPNKFGGENAGRTGFVNDPDQNSILIPDPGNELLASSLVQADHSSLFNM